MNAKRPDVRQEHDLLPPRLILYIMIGVIAFSVLLVYVAWRLQVYKTLELRPSGRFPEEHIELPIGVERIRFTLFDRPAAGIALHAEQRRALESYGWVDKERRIARIPIEEAMAIVATRK